MRLSSESRTRIKDVTQSVFGDNASVCLFGSRLDEMAKGGDIDLLIILETPTADAAALNARYNALLQMKLGLQKIDVLVVDPSTELKPIHQHALATAVRL